MVKSPIVPSSSAPPPLIDRGFTLIELLIVISISAILTAMAVPMFTDYVARQAVSAQISALATSVRVARSEALKRSMPVTLCPSSNPDAAQPTCAGAADATRGWATGWLMFTDYGTRGLLDADTDTVINRQSGFTNSGGISPTGGNGYTLTFLPNGLALNQQGGFVFKPKSDPDNTALQKVICVNAQGSTRTAKGGSCS